MNANNTNKLLKAKYNFDKFTSQNSQNWRLVLFWIIIFELCASLLEYLTFENTHDFVIAMPDSLTKQFLIALAVTIFIWGCIYTFVFENKTLFFWLILFAVTGIYLIVTQDVSFNFLLHNMEPTHFFQENLSIALIIELIFKLIITYLIYQLIISLKNRKKN